MLAMQSACSAGESSKGIGRLNDGEHALWPAFDDNKGTQSTAQLWRSRRPFGATVERVTEASSKHARRIQVLGVSLIDRRPLRQKEIMELLSGWR
jgi:hypothetical protein